MITFEVTGMASDKQLLHMHVVSAHKIERIDEATVNVTVEDELADEFSDWVDEQEEPYLTHRMV